MREYENKDPKVICASLGSPESCPLCAIAGADYPSDTAVYGTSYRHLTATAYSCSCVIYDSASRLPLATVSSSGVFPDTISPLTDKTDFRPVNSDIIDRVKGWAADGNISDPE